MTLSLYSVSYGSHYFVLGGPAELTDIVVDMDGKVAMYCGFRETLASLAQGVTYLARLSLGVDSGMSCTALLVGKHPVLSYIQFY